MPRSKQLFVALEEFRKEPEIASVLVDVRGQGLMVGVEFGSPAMQAHDAGNNAGAAAKTPAKFASRVSAKCMERGMLLLTTSVFEVRLCPLLAPL